MQTIIFNGKDFSGRIEKGLFEKILVLKKNKINPKLVSILIGNNKASLLYTSLKKKAAERVGAAMEVKVLYEEVTTEDVVLGIEKLNSDNSVHGIMVQMPIPKNLNKDKILNTISKEKDVDGLRSESEFVPATVKAILKIIEAAKKEVGHDFEHVVVVGSRGMVGKPLVRLLSELKYNVTECDIETEDLSKKTLKADLLISATGKAGLIKESMVKEGVCLIDVGAPRGDVDSKVYTKASFVTPVPGGVGPVTIVSLIDNLIIASQS